MGTIAQRRLRGVGLVVLLLAASAMGPLAWGQVRDAVAQSAGSADPVTVPITPFRLVDTRPAPEDPAGGPNEPFGQGESRSYVVAGVGAVPANAVGVVVNVTAVQATAVSFLTVYPSGSAVPLTSTLNPMPGMTVFNSATVLLGGGAFSVFHNAGSVHVIIDVVGYLVDHDHDERYLEQTEPIVITESASGWRGQVNDEPGAQDVSGAAFVVSAAGRISLPLTAPTSVGGTNYWLQSVEYCITRGNPAAYVDTARIISDELTGGVPYTELAVDPTDRTTDGCYSLAIGPNMARAFSLVLWLAGTSPTDATALYIHGVRTTWVPAI
jgi:hypothetical protein